MFHGRQNWEMAGRATTAPVFGLAAPRRSRNAGLVVDLAEDAFSARWWQGVATVALLCSAALATGLEIEPPFDVQAAGDPVQFRALGIAPLSNRSRTGLRMASSEAVEPLEFAPERPFVSFTARLAPADSVARMLYRAGADYADAVRVGGLIASSGRPIEPGTAIAVRLGEKNGRTRAVDRVALRAGLDMNLLILRSGQDLALIRQPIPVDATPLRIRGRVGDGLYWSLRAAGASPQTAAEYLQALAGEIDVGEMGPDDRFDLVLANRRSASGESRTGQLLYAGIQRVTARSLQLVRWPMGGRSQWVDAASMADRAAESGGMMAPVAGPITSRFGYRIHPILRYARFHSGVDFGAGWGAPIVAAASGRVAAAGWAGGYGRQVRIAHDDGLTSSYSHMSRMVVAAGSFVQRGELIGYVGSSGLSTGPHLHYEVIQGGKKVNPLSVRFASAPAVDPAQLNAFKARLAELLRVGLRKS